MISYLYRLKNPQERMFFVGKYYRGCPIERIVHEISTHANLSLTEKIDVMRLISSANKKDIQIDIELARQVPHRSSMGQKEKSVYFHTILHKGEIIQTCFGGMTHAKKVDAPYKESIFIESHNFYGTKTAVTFLGLTIPNQFMMYLPLPFSLLDGR